MNNLSQIMDDFCNIVMPGHDKKAGYINVRKLIKALNKSPKTYYNWKNKESYPHLSEFVKLLNDKGYRLKIEIDYSLNN